MLRQLRVAKINTPIMILSGSTEIETKVKTFGGGADDYLTKPFHKDELIARIHAVVRRSQGHAQSVIVTRRHPGQPGRQDDGGERGSRAPDRQGVPDAGAPFAAEGRDDHQGDVPEPSLRRHGTSRS